MKILIYIISLAAVSIIIFNLFQIDLENFFSKENFNYGIMILAGFSCLIIMRIMMLNEKINKAKKIIKELRFQFDKPQLLLFLKTLILKCLCIVLRKQPFLF